MKKPFYIIILSVLVLVYACDKSSKCPDYIGTGYSIADSSYKEFATSALFRIRENSELSLGFSLYNDLCITDEAVYFDNLFLNLKDTIMLKSAIHSGIIEEPSAFYLVYDGDATPVEEYILLDTVDSNNWIIIESINADSTEIQGTFNMSFITGNEKILSGERERWDDPNRPDTLHFTNGEFLAVRNN